MEIKPDSKYVTKQWLVLATTTLFFVIAGIVLHLLIPLKKGVTSGQLTFYIWFPTILIILLMWLISAPIIILWIKNLSYFIETDRVTIYKGILTKEQQNIPYRSITDFILHRSLYDRFLGVGTVRIQTAGQSRTATGYEGQLSGLINWEDMHQQLRGKLKILHPVSESTTVKEHGSPLLTDDKLSQILEELKAIRKVLENR